MINRGAVGCQIELKIAREIRTFFLEISYLLLNDEFRIFLRRKG